MSYTGGALDMTIEDSYCYEDFERDMELCIPVVIALEAGFTGVAAGICIDRPEMMEAVGRVTAYCERNYPEGDDEE